MPTHRAAAAPDSGSAPTLAPLRQWEGRLREASGWAAGGSPIEAMRHGEPAQAWSTTTGRSMAVVSAPRSLDAPIGSWTPRQGGAPALERIPAPAPRADDAFGLDAFEEFGANPFADDPFGDGPRHSTGPVALPSDPPPAPTHLPSPRAAQEQTFSPVRGRRALPDPITDPGLLLATPVRPWAGEAPAPRPFDEAPAPRPSGRRRSHAAPDAMPAPREVVPPGAGAGAALPPQTRRARREAASARAHALGGDDDAHAGPGLAQGPLTGRWMPEPEPVASDHRAAAAAVATALLDLPPSPHWTPQQLDWTPQQPCDEIDLLEAPETARDQASCTPSGPLAQPLLPGDAGSFVPSRGRSAHRRTTSRVLGMLPQAGLVGALGLATVLAPMASQHLPYLSDTGTAANAQGSGVGAVTAPVTAAARLLLGSASPATAAAELSGRRQSSASRSASRTTSPSASADPSSPSSAPASSSPSSVAASSVAPSTLTPSSQAPSTQTPSATAPSSQTPSTVPPSPAAALVLAPPTSTPSATASATPTVSAEQLAVAAMVPGCSGATPDTSHEVNGRLDSDDLCGLWQSGMALRSDAAVAFAKLNVAYKAHFGEDMQLTASYRPYADQVRLKATRPALAAVPGTSEHGWGLAVDLGDGVQNSDDHYTWLMANAPKYGWSHPAWAQRGGGGPYEPWHWEYAAGES